MAVLRPPTKAPVKHGATGATTVSRLPYLALSARETTILSAPFHLKPVLCCGTKSHSAGPAQCGDVGQAQKVIAQAGVHEGGAAGTVNSRRTEASGRNS